MKATFIFIVCFVMLSLSACVSIPSAAPKLSQELGGKISVLEESHVSLLHRYFDYKRAEIDRFIDNVWVPSFAKEVFSDPKLSQVWDEIVISNNKPDRLEFIIRSGPKLQAKINQKRTELIAPIEKLERAAEGQIRAHFNEARSINNSLTGLLSSAADVGANRDKYLEMIGVDSGGFQVLMDQTDNAISDMIDGVARGQEKVEEVKKYKLKLDELKSDIVRGKNNGD
jgi:hypothetical protein